MCLSLCSRLFHWGPLLALGIIMWVALATVYSNTMYWPPGSSWGGLLNMTFFLVSASLTTFHFFCAMCDGPGYLPLGWKPEKSADSKFLQFCLACKGFKAPRSHHCRKCERCVMKMDHHCPWINNCVGHLNHGHFVAFLAFAVVGSAQATVILGPTLYYGLHRTWYYYYGTGNEPEIKLTVATLLIVLLGFGLAIGVVLAIGALLLLQMRCIWRNQTGIEDWILEKAQYRRKDSGKKFQNPYNLGWRRNLAEVLTSFFSCVPKSDGIDWTIADGSHKYDLTVEQLNQKTEKRHRTRSYKIVKAFSGSWLPFWSMGFGVALRPPCTDEPRIKLDVDDVVNVTRWKKTWLYGDKVVGKNEERVRGWFPRKCAVDPVEFSGEERSRTKKERRKDR